MKQLAFIVATITLALLLPPVALAADGVPLYAGTDGAFDSYSMRHADMSGPLVGFELGPLPGAPGPTRIHAWNAATGSNWPLGSYPGLPASALQLAPSVVDRGGTVYCAWQQQSGPAASWDLYLWKGGEDGLAAAGYPLLLVSGPWASDQRAPDLGLVEQGNGKHLVLAWEDDRDGGASQTYFLDLSQDSDGDGTPDYEQSPSPESAGLRLDPTGDPVKGQVEPAVGVKGIFWLDRRNATFDFGYWLHTDVWRADLSNGSPVARRFWRETWEYGTAEWVHATADGAAWGRDGPYYAGSGVYPFAKTLEGTWRTVAWLTNPSSFDVTGHAYAVPAAHDGASDSDQDIFFTSEATSSSPAVLVCGVGGYWNSPALMRQQTEPAIAKAAGGWRVVWSDSRHVHNPDDISEVPWDELAFRLYVARVPTVTLGADNCVVPAGHPVTLTSRVKPDFAGAEVRFQRGKREVWSTPEERIVSYRHWRNLKSKRLSAVSRATWRWTPQAKGTCYIRVWFVGGKRYTDVGSRKVPHVPNVSRVIKIVVK